MSCTIDTEAIHARFGGDREIIQEIVGLFLGDYPMLLKEIRLAVAKRNSAALTLAAHTLKGVLSNFTSEGAAIANKLEEKGRHQDWTGIDEVCADVESMLDAVVPELARLLPQVAEA